MTITPFGYPNAVHSRQHGPQGYADYPEYRDWVRDDFSFKCVFCLYREVWLGGSTVFHLDHAVAQKHEPGLRLVYDNLLYLCSFCNLSKQAKPLVDPCSTALSECLAVSPDGEITSKNAAGRRLVLVLRLDSRDRVRFRRKIIALSQDPKHILEWFCYPQDLPDLRAKRPPSNVKPTGVANCHFARRERGELEATY